MIQLFPPLDLGRVSIEECFTLTRCVLKKKRDWHKKWEKSDPECGPQQWRCRDRNEVINISDMTDSHLKHAIRFASTKSQHSSRMTALSAENGKRNHNHE